MIIFHLYTYKQALAFTPDSPSNPAIAYRQLPQYPRSSSVTGVDLKIKALEDFETTPTGDFATVTGAELITQALLRRLKTPTYGYRRWVRSADGLEEVDTDYGDRVYEYLSAPLTAFAITKIKQAVKEAALADGRIDVIETEVIPSSNRNELELVLYYRIKPESELAKLAYVLTV